MSNPVNQVISKIKLQVFPYIIFNFCKNILNLDNLISTGLKSVLVAYYNISMLVVYEYALWIQQLSSTQYTAYFVLMYSYFMHKEKLHTMTSIYTVCYKKSESSRLHANMNLYLYLFDVHNDCFISLYDHVKECLLNSSRLMMWIKQQIWRRISSEMSQTPRQRCRGQTCSRSAAGRSGRVAFVMNDSFSLLTVMSLEFCSEALMFAESVCTAEDSGIIWGDLTTF